MELRRFVVAPAIGSLLIGAVVLRLQGGGQAPAQTNRAGGTQSTSAPQGSDPKFAAFVYDVVSIKPFKDVWTNNMKWFGTKESPDGLTANCPVVLLVKEAYQNEDTSVAGTSGWVHDDNYDVEAKMEREVAEALEKLSTTDQALARQHMLQVLLQDRFKLAFHAEPKEVTGFDLVIAKKGHKLKDAQPSPRGEAQGRMNFRSSDGATEWIAHGMGISGILGQLSFEAGRPVFDKTGLTGSYDFTLKFTSDRPTLDASPSGLDSAPPLAAALEEQLGLKLVTSKGNIDYIVIDHIERPSSN